MDAYMMLRFCRVCTRACASSRRASAPRASCRCPRGRQGLPDFYRYTMANIQRTCSPGSDGGEGCCRPGRCGARVNRLWRATERVFAAHACYLLNHE